MLHSCANLGVRCWFHDVLGDALVVGGVLAGRYAMLRENCNQVCCTGDELLVRSRLEGKWQKPSTVVSMGHVFEPGMYLNGRVC